MAHYSRAVLCFGVVESNVAVFGPKTLGVEEDPLDRAELCKNSAVWVVDEKNFFGKF